MFQILILFLSFTFEIYSLSCFVNGDPTIGIDCYRKYFDDAKRITENCAINDESCYVKTMDTLNAGAVACKCDFRIANTWCNWVDPERFTQGFMVNVPANLADSTKLPSIQMEKCEGYLSHYQNLFKECRGCDEKSGPQFWCKNEPLIETWCKGRRNESSLIDMQNSVSDFLNRF